MLPLSKLLMLRTIPYFLQSCRMAVIYTLQAGSTLQIITCNDMLTFMKMRGGVMLHQVNKIREVPGHADVVVTHSDSKELFVWHTERQPNRKEKVSHCWC